MQQAIRWAADAVVLTAQLYLELASSALTLVPRRTARES